MILQTKVYTLHFDTDMGTQTVAYISKKEMEDTYIDWVNRMYPAEEPITNFDDAAEHYSDCVGMPGNDNFISWDETDVQFKPDDLMDYNRFITGLIHISMQVGRMLGNSSKMPFPLLRRYIIRAVPEFLKVSEDTDEPINFMPNFTKLLAEWRKEETK